ncbi:MAG TPA: PIN domain-containing protein [Dehalococcoidia bacterium]|nr:PIN domain-containing protein [Dehalococcoidia bacterium]
MIDELAQVTTVALDTSPIIYAFEDHPQFGPVVRPVFEAIGRQQLHAVASSITLVEVLTAPLRAGNTDLSSIYREFLLETDRVTTMPVTTEIAQRAAQLRATYGLRTADAIVAATAMVAGCDAVLTNDEDLKALESIKVIYVNDFS